MTLEETTVATKLRRLDRKSTASSICKSISIAKAMIHRQSLRTALASRASEALACPKMSHLSAGVMVQQVRAGLQAEARVQMSPSSRKNQTIMRQARSI